MPGATPRQVFFSFYLSLLFPPLWRNLWETNLHISCRGLLLLPRIIHGPKNRVVVFSDFSFIFSSIWFGLLPEPVNLKWSLLKGHRRKRFTTVIDESPWHERPPLFSKNVSRLQIDDDINRFFPFEFLFIALEKITHETRGKTAPDLFGAIIDFERKLTFSILLK